MSNVAANGAEVVSAWAAVLMVLVTAGAFIAAICAAKAAGRIYQIERQRDDVARDERAAVARSQMRAKAELISVWQTLDPAKANWPGEGIGQSNAPQQAWAVVANSSALPVYRLTVTFSSNTADIADTRATVPVVPPGQVKLREPGNVIQGGAISTGRSNGYNYAVSITFRDSAGVRWIRDAQGMLSDDPRSESDVPG
jgi:hypothetical protein